MYLNKVLIIGNLTRDPELKALPSGTKVCNLAVATNRYYKDKDGNKQESVEFHAVVAFSKTGELAGTYLKKGQNVLIEGRIQTRSWDGADGQKRYRTEIIAETIQFGAKVTGGGGGTSGGGDSYKGGGAPKDDGSATGPSSPAAESGEKIEYPQEEINPDDIPF